MNLSINTVEALLEKHGSYLDDYCSDYGEPGYTKEYPDQPILFANWNPLPKAVMRGIERRLNIEWSDEWISDHESDKAYRTQPDCYGWRPYYLFNDWTNGEVLGGDEIEGDYSLQSAYIEEYLLNDSSVCCMFDIDLSQHGFEQINGDFENGWYGVRDNPKQILEYWQEKLPDHDFIFGNYSSGQFSVDFNLYGRRRDAIN